MRVGNRVCSPYVTRCEPFDGSHLCGIKVSDALYVVYSYGYWPCWACIDGKWYGHKGKYSGTTSAHTSASRPELVEITILDGGVESLKELIESHR